MKRLFFACLALVALAACSQDDGYGGSLDARYGAMSGMGDGFYSPSGPGDPGAPAGEAGVLTAGEWNDLSNWDFWGNLMKPVTPPATPEEAQQVVDYRKMAMDWGFNTAGRVAVHVTNGSGTPVIDLPVELLKDGEVVWKARTSNLGEAQLWHDLFAADGQERPATGLQIRLGGALQPDAPTVSTLDAPAVINEYTVTAAAPPAVAQIAFIVDATGSMSDEIAFLKKDLLSILERVKQSQSGVSISTGAVFYRDKGDAYLTRANDFTTPSKTIDYVKKQGAEGGGDLPEAVHSALETSLQKLSWAASARARVAFLILDAPAHIDQDGVIASLQNSIRTYASLGIRLIPVVASTGDKTTEFMCRDFAIVTGGTYVFLTDDSGVGESHLTPTVGTYTVEKLNDLLYRLLDAALQ